MFSSQCNVGQLVSSALFLENRSNTSTSPVKPMCESVNLHSKRFILKTARQTNKNVVYQTLWEISLMCRDLQKISPNLNFWCHRDTTLL